jgi:hypothetical protein
MTWFLVIGGVGLAIVLTSLVLHDVFEGVFEALHVDVGGGLFSTPVIGSFLTAFGFGGALALSAGDVGAGVAALVGLAAGVGMGAVGLLITRSLMHMRTDEPVRLNDMVGKSATVVSPIPAAGFGEVSLVHLGQRMKLNARAPDAIRTGEVVIVVAVNSASSVLVEREDSFWGRTAPLEKGE